MSFVTYPITRSLLTVTAVAAALGFGVACSSKSSGSTTAKARPAGTTQTKPAPLPTTTTKPVTKPSGSTSKPAAPPPPEVTGAVPLAFADQLTAPEALSLGIACPTGLGEGKGVCLKDAPSILLGCVSADAKVLNCDLFDDASHIAYCDDDAAAGCFTVDLSPLTDISISDVSTYGAVVSDADCKPEQDSHGFCSGDTLFGCKSGKVYSLTCQTVFGSASGLTCQSVDGQVGCQ